MPQQQGSSMSETKPSQRFHSLNSEQVEVLDQVLSEVVPIHGRGNFPTLELRPRDIITAVRTRLEKQGITVRDVRLNGSTASHVLVRDNGTSYKDLDIIFGVELPRQEDFQVIKESVLGCLLDCLPAGVNRERISSATMKEAYVQKMVKVFNEHDRWSLISLSNNSGKNLELKFVSALRRQFEFSVDSFQIILDRLLECYLQQESQHTDSSVDLKDRTVENQNKDSLSLPEDATTPHTESLESTNRDLSSNEEVEISEPEQNDEMEDSHVKEPQNELSQETEISNQTKHPKQEECEKQKMLSKMKETSEYRENLREMDTSDQASLSPFSEKKQHYDEASQAEPAQKPEVSDQTECSTQVEHSEQTQALTGKQAAESNRTEKHSAQTKQSTHTEPLEQKELINQIGCSEAPKNSNPTPTESLNLAEESHSKEHSYKTDISECLSEDQRSNEEDKTHHLPAPDTSTSTQAEIKTHTDLGDDRKMDIETRKQIEAERKNDAEITETTGEISTTETNHVENTQAIDDSCSTYSLSLTFSADNTQLTGTQHTPEIHSTLHTNNSEKIPNTLDPVNPPDTQDILPAPPSLVSDKKTSSLPPTKASSRLSQMVVLKHSSPKPPRRMCRKVTPNPNPNPVPETEPVIAAVLDSNTRPSPEPEIAFNPEPSIVSNPVTAPSSDFSPTKTTMTPTIENPGPEPYQPTNLAPDLDLISAPDPAPDPSPISAGDPRSTLPQEPPSSQLNTEAFYETAILSMKETQSEQVAYDEPSQKESSPCSSGETSSPPKKSEPPDTLETPLSHTDGCNTNAQDPTQTSEAELSDEDENRDLQIKTTDLDQLSSTPSTPDEKETPLSSPSSFHCGTPPISCLTPPVLSLSPPCFTSSPGSLSPPPCLTPPSHCLNSPILNVSPPPSFSPTSSSLSSPPYLTPPLLSLSPPPLCLTPPSPCLSPPLLCLTPPVETEDLVPQVSSDLEPLIHNTESEGQIIQSSSQPAVPLLQSEDEKEQDNISSLPQVSEPVSFPLTIPSSTSDMLPRSQPGETGESAPPKAAEASSSEPQNKEAPQITSDKPEESKAPRASGSVPAVEVLAESMYGDFEAAMDHLRYRLIATRNPEEIRGGGLLKYSNLLVRDYRPASETQIKTLERYMCSRFFIDFPDVQEQQRKILSYLKNHFIGEERSKYQYLMTLRRVVDDSTVCLMGHERRQTLNMITVLALKVLGEQNIIPNTDHVTCFYQPAPYLAEHSAPYMAEPSYCSYYIPQGGSTLLYQPYPLHLHTQTGMV